MYQDPLVGHTEKSFVLPKTLPSIAVIKEDSLRMNGWDIGFELDNEILAVWF